MNNNRLEILLRHRPAAGIALEVAPYFNPALPKAAGNTVLIVDVFDTETLRARALLDPNIPDDRISEIEEVDIVGDASGIGELMASHALTGKVSFIVSSHNFEHLPNPIRFLRGVQDALKPGGILSMAIPDFRATFDHFRSPTRLVDWLEAYHNHHAQPTSNSIFDLATNAAEFPIGTTLAGSADWRTFDPQKTRLSGNLRDAYEDWTAARTEIRDYVDTHVSVISDLHFRLMVEDLRHLGLIDLEILEITNNHGHEFFAHLRRPVTPVQSEDPATYKIRREAMLLQIAAGLGDQAFPYVRSMMVKEYRRKRWLRSIVGETIFDRFQTWNKLRKRKRANRNH